MCNEHKKFVYQLPIYDEPYFQFLQKFQTIISLQVDRIRFTTLYLKLHKIKKKGPFHLSSTNKQKIRSIRKIIKPSLSAEPRQRGVQTGGSVPAHRNRKPATFHQSIDVATRSEC